MEKKDEGRRQNKFYRVSSSPWEVRKSRGVVD